MNRLAKEKSPYLLQHARNPVDWYPWGEEAFAAARRDDKPVFLSIGYATCHWCHVMERESFEDEDVARLLNEAFVCVKVDREERPDLDHHYMSVCQLLTGSGGWPLTVLLAPDKSPFFAATYIPRENRYGRLGMKALIPRLREAWRSDPGTVAAAAERIRQAMVRQTSPPDETPPAGTDLGEEAFRELEASFDGARGGFGPAPKFPVPHQLTFLLRYTRRTGRGEAESMAVRTLEAMSRGGLFDHLGGGFHRYSVDREWLVPHFEKMLYDQALQALAYAEGALATGRTEFKETAERVLGYMLRDLGMPGGGFASAEDADSEGEEGTFYLWTDEDFRRILEPGEAEEALAHFQVLPGGNFSEAGRAPDGKNILHLAPSGREAVSGSPGGGSSADRLAGARAKLLAARSRRLRPLRDDKVLADWNGLAVAALSVCGRELDRPDFLREAERTADFLGEKMRRPDGGLFHRYRNGEAAIPAFLDDYAFVIRGLIELFQSTFRAQDLSESVRLAGRVVADFWDEDRGGFFFSSENDNELPVRRKEFADGALPSGNSVMAGNLLFLARLTADPFWEDLFDRLNRAVSPRASAGPASFAHYLGILELTQLPFIEAVIVGRPGAPDTEALLAALRRKYRPAKVVLLRPAGPEAEPLLEVAPFLRPFLPVGSRAAAYICTDFRCRAPITSPEDLLSALREKQHADS